MECGFITPEFIPPEYQPDLDFEDHPWEESRGMGFSYGYNRAEDAWDYNSTQSLVLHLIDKVSRGGNFLLDIGPDEHGNIPPIMQDRLLEIGKWLKVNGEAIYGTRRWRTASQWSEGRRDWKAAQEEGWKTGGDALLKQTVDPDPGYAVKELFFTWNEQSKSLCAIFPTWPSNRKITVKGLQLPENAAATLLATGQKLQLTRTDGNVVIQLPEYDPNKIKTGYAWGGENFRCARICIQTGDYDGVRSRYRQTNYYARLQNTRSNAAIHHRWHSPR